MGSAHLNKLTRELQYPSSQHSITNIAPFAVITAATWLGVEQALNEQAKDVLS